MTTVITEDHFHEAFVRLQNLKAVHEPDATVPLRPVWALLRVVPSASDYVWGVCKNIARSGGMPEEQDIAQAYLSGVLVGIYARAIAEGEV